MSEENFEEFLQREAQSYNEPPARIPRDEMFAAITAARRANAVASPIVGVVRTSRFRHYAWIGMAATLVIGVAIGKYAFAKRDLAAPVALTANKAAGAGTKDPSASTGNTKNPSAGASSGPYAQAATDQLSRAEALLTAYGASAPNAGVDKQLSAWARDVLTNTRLLLDSPAADDPARQRLLQDLELVLVQMVQRSPTAGAGEERSHIDRSLERTQMLSRLRSALPAGRAN